jgi:NADPH:quinone reductase-like Zn-dependent oxidoreductase
VKAIVQDEYGPPDVLHLENVPVPEVGDDDVLVRVRAASANAGDWHLMRADPFFIRLMFGGLRRPKIRVLGADIAGRVEAVGRNVVGFRPGDEVFGNLAESGFGGFAEYVAAPERALVPKPAGVSFEEAAAVPQAALAALQGLRDKGSIRAGSSVLVNGASGGVGSFAVQIAKSYGATVTGVCSTRSADMVRMLGADHVVDYTREDVTRNGERYDLILDAAARRPPTDYRRSLRDEGVYVMVGGETIRLFQTMLLAPFIAATGSARMAVLMSAPNRAELGVLVDLLEAGANAPVIDRTFALEDVPEAIRYLEEEHVRGKVVIALEDDSAARSVS